MKKLKILVADDTEINIEAAKIASENFPQHEFFFTSSAKESFNVISDFDAIITDLLFLELPSEEMSEIYEEMQSVYSESSYYYKEVKGNSPHLFPYHILEKNVSVVKNGLKNSQDKIEFPLGIPIMIKANKEKKKVCLVSNIHCHGDIDGQVVLLPLVRESILTVNEIKYDGYNGIKYIGSSRIYNFDPNSEESKANPLIWEKAIHCILVQ